MERISPKEESKINIQKDLETVGNEKRGKIAWHTPKRDYQE